MQRTSAECCIEFENFTTITMTQGLRPNKGKSILTMKLC